MVLMFADFAFIGTRRIAEEERCVQLYAREGAPPVGR